MRQSCISSGWRRSCSWTASDEGEGAVGEASGPLRGLDPNGEDLSGEVAGAGGVEVEVAGAVGGGEVPGFVGEALRCVGVGVEDEGGAVHSFGVWGFVH